MQNVKEFRKVPTFASAYRDLFRDTLIRLPHREAIKAYESFELNFIGRPQELTSSIDEAAKEKANQRLDPAADCRSYWPASAPGASSRGAAAARSWPVGRRAG